MRTTVHRSIRYPGLLSLARQERAIRLDYAELRQGSWTMLSCAKGDARWETVKPRLRAWRQIMVGDIANGAAPVSSGQVA
jgi:hypothetical protein